MKIVRRMYVFFFFTISIMKIYGIVHIGLHGDIIKQYNNRLYDQGILDDIALYCKISQDSGDQIVKKGEFAHYKDAKANIIICHGFMCDHHDVAMLRYAIFEPGIYNVMTFDFRAHGSNDHNEDTQYCTFGKNEIQELIAAAQFIKQYPDKKIAELPIIIYGFSMGAVVAIEASSQDPALCSALILDCPFDSSEDVIKRSLESINFEFFGYTFSLPGKHMLRQYAFHPYVQGLVKRILKSVANLDTQNIEIDLHPVFPKESIKKINAPCFFIHCNNDQKIPLSAVMEVYKNAPGYKRFWITAGRRHFDSFFYHPELYKRVIQAFLNRVIEKNQKTAEKKEKIIIDEQGDSNVIALLEF